MSMMTLVAGQMAMDDYDLMWSLLSNGIERMNEGQLAPKLRKDHNDSDNTDIIICEDGGDETWYYFNGQPRKLMGVRIYSR